MNVSFVGGIPARSISWYLQTDKRILWLAGCCGAILASWMVLQAHGEINRDGIQYIEVARLFSVGDWRGGFKLFGLALYPLLIMSVHMVSGFSLQISAHILAVSFFSTFLCGLLVLVKEVGGDRRTMLAALVLSLCSPYMVGTSISLVIRDHGFWATHIWSLVFFVRFLRDPVWKNALVWGVLSILAAMFRIEGVGYMVFLPVLTLMSQGVLHNPGTSRRSALLKLNALWIAAAITGLIVFLLIPALHLPDIVRLYDPVKYASAFHLQITQGIDSKAKIFGQLVLGDLASYAFSGMILTLGYVLLVKALGISGWIQLGFAFFAIRQRASILMPKYAPVFKWLVMLSLAFASLSLLIRFQLPKRYLMPLGFVILLYASFGLVAAYDAWRNKTCHRIIFILFPVALLLLLVQLAVLVRPTDPMLSHEVKAGRWIAEHIPEDKNVFFDSARLRYYATGQSSKLGKASDAKIKEVFGSLDTPPTALTQPYDYLVVGVSTGESDLEQFLLEKAGAPLVEFDNGRGGKVLIFKTAKQ